jgi:hypothetical protein
MHFVVLMQGGGGGGCPPWKSQDAVQGTRPHLAAQSRGAASWNPGHLNPAEAADPGHLHQAHVKFDSAT